MSKKKSSGNTMTLKDFHGGSIPSDLPLPSAPGVTPRSTTDRPGYDRASWGASTGRSDQRTRPSSSHSIRNFDDKTPFLPHTANIGRHFNEDERKPLDGPSAPRRMVSDEVFQTPVTRVGVKADSVLAGRLTSWQGEAGPWPVRKIDIAHLGSGNQMVEGNNEKSMSGTYPNAWASQWEMTRPSSEPGHSPWATPSAISKLVHLPAVEQVSSEIWHSKLVAPSRVESLNHSELEGGLYKTNDYALDLVDVGRERESSDVMLARHMEKGLAIEDGILSWRKVSPEYEKGPAPAYLEVKDGNAAVSSSNRPYPNHSDARYGISAVQPTVPSESVERPKLKLLPRTKPLEIAERPLSDAKQERGTFKAGYMTQKSMNTSEPGFSADESSNQQTERPKLNLKPISQLLEQPSVNPERERNAVFGGARPRELVLEERGVDKTGNRELEQQLERFKPNVPKTERVLEEEEVRPGGIVSRDRSETQWRNWQNNDNNSRKKKSTRENEKKPQPSTQEKKRNPSPETWRKPIEPQKPESRYGKAASALELAQAFSKPFSDPRTSSNFNNGQRGGFSGRDQVQVPFSRLLGSAPTPTPTRRQINGY